MGTERHKDCKKHKDFLVVGNLVKIEEETLESIDVAEGIDVVEGIEVIEESSGYLSFHQFLLSAVLIVLLIVTVVVCMVYEYRYSAISRAVHKARINITVWNPSVEHIQY